MTRSRAAGLLLSALRWVTALGLAAFAFLVARRLVVPPWEFPGYDILPLYLGGLAILDGLDPHRGGALAYEWHHHGWPGGPGGFQLLYPVSAVALFLPLTSLPLRSLSLVLQVASTAALLLSGLSAGLMTGRSPSGGRWSAALASAALGVLVVASLDAGPPSIRIGQVNPFIVFATALAAALLVRGWDLAAGAWIGFGAAVKFFPGILLLPAILQRRWGVLLGLGLSLGLVATLTFLVWPAWSPWSEITALLGHVGPGNFKRELSFWSLWTLRVYVFGLPTAALLAFLGARRRDLLARHAGITLTLCYGALVAGTLPPPIEVLLVAPGLIALVGLLAAEGWGPFPLVVALAAAGAALLDLDGFTGANPEGAAPAHALVLGMYVLATLQVLRVATRGVGVGQGASG